MMSPTSEVLYASEIELPSRISTKAAETQFLDTVGDLFKATECRTSVYITNDKNNICIYPKIKNKIPNRLK